jgi:hypothetical protein
MQKLSKNSDTKLKWWKVIHQRNDQIVIETVILLERYDQLLNL